MATKAETQFLEAVDELIKESPVNALSVLTSAFVGLTVAMVSHQGHLPNGEIKIDGGDSRDITIHAEKSPSQRDEEACHGH